MAIRGKEDVSGFDFSPGGENAISSAAGVLGWSHRRMYLSDGRVGLEIQGTAFDE